MTRNAHDLSFTTDDIALAVEIRGVYDGTAVYLLKDGRLINRFRCSNGWSEFRINAADSWIAEHGEQLRADNQDLLNPGGEPQ